MASDGALESQIQGKHYFQVGQGFPRGTLCSAAARWPPPGLRQCPAPPPDLLSAASSLQTRGAPLSPNHRAPARPFPLAVQFKAVPGPRLLPQIAANCRKRRRCGVRSVRAGAQATRTRIYSSAATRAHALDCVLSSLIWVPGLGEVGRSVSSCAVLWEPGESPWRAFRLPPWRGSAAWTGAGLVGSGTSRDRAAARGLAVRSGPAAGPNPAQSV